MNLSPRYIAAFTLMIAAMFGWNAFLIVRDTQLFKSYAVCQQSTHHPNCVK